MRRNRMMPSTTSLTLIGLGAAAYMMYRQNKNQTNGNQTNNNQSGTMSNNQNSSNNYNDTSSNQQFS